jgi:hypothetical protein
MTPGTIGGFWTITASGRVRARNAAVSSALSA